MHIRVDLTPEQAAWLAAEAARRRPSRPAKSPIVADLIQREMDAQVKAACDSSIGQEVPR